MPEAVKTEHIPMQPELKPSNTKKIIAQVESTLNTFAWAINARRLDPDDHIYKDAIDPAFTAHLCPPYDTNLGWDGYRAHFETIFAEYPNHLMLVRTMQTTVDEKAGHADCFINFESHNCPPTVVRKRVAIFRFRRAYREEKELWRCCFIEVLHGIEMAESASEYGNPKVDERFGDWKHFKPLGDESVKLAKTIRRI